MKFKLFQIQLTDAEVVRINATGHDSVPKQAARMKMMFGNNNNNAPVAAEAVSEGFYTHVSNIVAEDLDGVFEVGNIGPEANIERLSPMSSVSVGDLIEDEDGNRSLVAPFGFEAVPA